MWRYTIFKLEGELSWEADTDLDVVDVDINF